MTPKVESTGITSYISRANRLICMNSHQRLLLLVKLQAQEQAFNWLLIGWAIVPEKYGIDDWSHHYQASECYYIAYNYSLNIFTKIKLLIINRESILTSQGVHNLAERDTDRERINKGTKGMSSFTFAFSCHLFYLTRYLLHGKTAAYKSCVTLKR